MRILAVIGTRPEAIKMAPVLVRLGAERQVELATCVSGQHRELMDQALGIFRLVPDFDLEVMNDARSPTDVLRLVLERLPPVLREFRPDRVLVHGDTTTSFAGALAAYHERVPVAHVEAGLRTGRLYSPWPEELNRKLTASIADMHFAPTRAARRNLRQEGVPSEHIHVTGNTIVDALNAIVERIHADRPLARKLAARFSFLDPSKRLLVVTAHRRENQGEGLLRVCAALEHLAARGDVEIVFPVHPSPAVRGPVESRLSGVAGIRLLEPLDYIEFLSLLLRADLVCTDSGGVQEEAPCLGKPVLVLREVTERTESLCLDSVSLVGTDPGAIFREASRFLDWADTRGASAGARELYGDGKASERIVACLVGSMAAVGRKARQRAA